MARLYLDLYGLVDTLELLHDAPALDHIRQREVTRSLDRVLGQATDGLIILHERVVYRLALLLFTSLVGGSLCFT